MRSVVNTDGSPARSSNSHRAVPAPISIGSPTQSRGGVGGRQVRRWADFTPTATPTPGGVAAAAVSMGFADLTVTPQTLWPSTPTGSVPLHYSPTRRTRTPSSSYTVVPAATMTAPSPVNSAQQGRMVLTQGLVMAACESPSAASNKLPSPTHVSFAQPFMTVYPGSNGSMPAMMMGYPSAPSSAGPTHQLAPPMASSVGQLAAPQMVTIQQPAPQQMLAPQQVPRPPSPVVPLQVRNPTMSVGCGLHGTGQCKPCAWYWKPQGCANAQNCQHCHMCSKDELKNRKKAKVAVMRSTEARH